MNCKLTTAILLAIKESLAGMPRSVTRSRYEAGYSDSCGWCNLSYNSSAVHCLLFLNPNLEEYHWPHLHCIKVKHFKFVPSRSKSDRTL